MLVERLQEDNVELHKPALEALKTQIRTSTSSMTSVPKPLKFLRSHYPSLKDVYAKMTDNANKKFLADIISILAMTQDEEGECLRYCLLGSVEDIGSWGHEFIRHLSNEISVEYCDRVSNHEDMKPEIDDLLNLVRQIVHFEINHNAIAGACDILMEIERTDMLLDYVDESNYDRACLYLTSCAKYLVEPEDAAFLKTTLRIYRKFNRYCEALRIAIKLNNMDLITEIFSECKDEIGQKQMAYILARQQIFIELNNGDIIDELYDIMSNSNLNTNFLSLARELDIMEPKIPEDIFKSHLDPNRLYDIRTVDSAKQNLASSFVNAFLNCGFGSDKIMAEDSNKWIHKNKDHGMLSATASMGLIQLWDIDAGLTQIDKFLYASEDYVKAGALLACGIVNSGLYNDCDPALALLSDYVLHNSLIIRIGTALGLGIAYAGSHRRDVINLLIPVINDPKSTFEVSCKTALACGLIAIGTSDGDVTTAILQFLMGCKKEQLNKDANSIFLILGLALTYIGKRDAIEAPLAAIEMCPQPFEKSAGILIESCSQAGYGDVLRIQTLLQFCSAHYQKDKNDEDDKQSKDNKDKSNKDIDYSSTQAISVISISLMAMCDEISSEMALRIFGHMLSYCDSEVRRAIPLALGLLSASNPQLAVVDTLSKLSHDHDTEVVHNAIFALGIVAAGTNNARIAGMLRQLAQYYYKDANNLFMVRIAQGLVHLGKGTMTVNPYHSDRSLLSPVALGGLLTVLCCMLEAKETILGKSHYMLYCLVCAIHPRLLVTFDTELKPLPVSVRVGQAVDVVGQAGKPKTITGFQTHTTPVLLTHGERAELATDEYIPEGTTLEGFVILKKNPDYQA
ncbi:uncharacterized protein TRIADDRAFT_36957 [Trichoplax adhaerens]|uniref:26S proteasome non-ATPase regulatory subunit 2 n=1 Tax=Trichoplax adhaerens TaxID=10228 RepID=B3RL38_TRIAD|nr:hypothetical protein TRIADDRAFT_36957 [Trichoplax adhaerens]EDV28694.1 hypothetical protein TRIADDRAFT_36957 [Trichoplax adhaerens]|eukprot:XP_002107896.1 hypothetical protein TRIADDRAFT_36957 [Trichoplax adhaerens]